MKIEHVAFNVSDPAAVADWYCKHLDFTVVRHQPGPHDVHFLADSGHAMMIEIYHNPPGQVPDYAGMDPLVLHLALSSEDPEGDALRLEQAGATMVSHTHLDDGSQLVMMRDPWEFPLQLCKRGSPFIGR